MGDAVTTNLVDSDALIAVPDRIHTITTPPPLDASGLLDQLLTEAGIHDLTLALIRRLTDSTNTAAPANSSGSDRF
nr:hypothetical protein [Rhodococcus erythropolis]